MDKEEEEEEPFDVEMTRGGGGTSEVSGISEEEEDQEDGPTLAEQMKVELRKVVVADLTKDGMAYDMLVNAIIDPDAPLFNFTNRTKTNGEALVVGKYKQMDQSWKDSRPFWSMRQHLFMFDRRTNLYHLSVKQRVVYLMHQAGFSQDVAARIKTEAQFAILRMEDVWSRVKIDMDRPESDFLYWCTILVLVKTDMMKAQWKMPNEDTIEITLIELMAAQKFAEDEDLNSGAKRVPQWYEELLQFQKDAGSERTEDPAYLFGKFRRSLAIKGNDGLMMDRIIDKSVKSVVADPVRNMPKNHLAPAIIQAMVGKTSSKLPVAIIRVILEDIATRGHQKQLSYIFQGGENLDSFTGSGKKGKAKSLAVNAVVTEPVTFANNVIVAGGGGGGSAREKSDARCPSCHMFCGNHGDKTKEGTCKIFAKGNFSIKDFLQLPGAIHKTPTRWVLSNQAQDKLNKYAFPAMKIKGPQITEAIREIGKGINVLFKNQQKGGGASKIVNNVSATSDSEKKKTTKTLKERLKKLEKENEALKKAQEADSEEEGESDEQVD
jgi:hypothetical protein